VFTKREELLQVLDVFVSFSLLWLISRAAAKDLGPANPNRGEGENEATQTTWMANNNAEVDKKYVQYFMVVPF